MGCCCSSGSRPPQDSEKPHRVTNEHLVGVNIRDFQGVAAPRLQDALKKAGSHLQEKGENITVIASGGPVDVCRLKGDHAINDMFFFNSNLQQPQRDALKAAFELGERTYNAPLAQALWNQAAVGEMGYDLEEGLTKAALNRGRVLLETGGLKVIACPLTYSFTTKASRLGTNDQRHYDLKDAVEYLEIIIEDNKRETGRIVPVDSQIIEHWCRKGQNAMLSQEQLRMINNEYKERNHPFYGIRF